MNTYLHIRYRLSAAVILLLILLITGSVRSAIGHPLGNFTINQFGRITIHRDYVTLDYIVDMAEISTIQELQNAGIRDANAPTTEELNGYLRRVADDYARGLHLVVDETTLSLEVVKKEISLLPGAGGLKTLRVECAYKAALSAQGSATRLLHFADNNHRDRIGWHELVVNSTDGISVFDSSIFGSAITDELKSYPQDGLDAPLNERTGDLSFIRGPSPTGTKSLMARDGRPVTQSRDRLAELIAVPAVTPAVALLGILVAFVLGGLHALSPGHGKTIVGAYLVGTKGTARHAAFLGLTVTITHTIGVFALGLVTLLASQYIVPERIFPFLSFISGAIVVAIGLTLFVRRLRTALNRSAQMHTHDAGFEHDHEHPLGQGITHSHGGVEHSHLPPGADGSPVTWRSLMALGISGGLLPCPSALVVLLAAISLHRVGYGLVLVTSFSFGLASVLTLVGLVFVFAGRFFKSSSKTGFVQRVLPAASALVITCAGLAICYESLAQAGLRITRLFTLIGALFNSVISGDGPALASAGVWGVVGLGLVFGLKHATEVDHVVAVSTIVSEQRGFGRAALVGGLWGVGHTASLIVIGVVVLALRIAIPEQVARWMEFGIAIMIVTLGTSAIARALARRSDIHPHRHSHGSVSHTHFHFHEEIEHSHDDPRLHERHILKQIGLKPLLVGCLHGLAGSAALTLLILAQINSVTIGLLYLAVFGLGSIVGMLIMSGLVGLPFAFSSRKLVGIHHALQLLAGAFSVTFGLWYAYETALKAVLSG